MAIALVQSASAGSVDTYTSVDVTLGAAPTDGNLLIAAITVRNGTGVLGMAGWTSIGAEITNAGLDLRGLDLFYKIAGAGESATITSANVGSHYKHMTVAEFSGVSAFDTSDGIGQQYGSSLTAGPVSPAGAAEILLIGTFAVNTASTGYTPGASYTEITDAAVPGALQPSYTVEYQIVTSPSGSYSATATAPATNDWAGIVAVFSGASLPPGVYVDWDDDGFSVDDEITDDVAAIRFQQGASAEITGGAQPGSAAIELVNPSSDIYNPLNSGGALYGKILDGRPVYAGIADDGTFTGTGSNGLFGGRLGDITPKPQGGLARPLFVTLACEDALGWYGRTPGRVADGLFRSQAAFRGLILTAVGETRTDLAHETMTMPISSWDGDALPGLEALNKANGTRHYIRPGSHPAAWYQYVTVNRQHRLDGTTDGTLDAGSDHVTGTDGWRLSASTVVNQQKATTVPITFTSGTVTVWEAPTLPIGVTTAKPYETWVEFDDFVQGAVADVNYTGTAPTVTLTPFGTSAKLTITSAGTTTITALSIEGSLLRRGVAESVVEDNTPSQAGSRGVRAGSEISGELVGVKAAAQGIAAHVVWRYGDPQYRPTLTVENWFPGMFQVEMFDVLAITIDGLSMTARHFEVVGRAGEIRIAAAAVQSASVTYVLQECRVQSDPGWFVLDSSLLDGADVLAY